MEDIGSSGVHTSLVSRLSGVGGAVDRKRDTIGFAFTYANSLGSNFQARHFRTDSLSAYA
jgi:hypothetical protein